jgi:chromosome segregation ATPase
MPDLQHQLLEMLEQYLKERDSALIAQLNAVTQRLEQDARDRRQLADKVRTLREQVNALTQYLAACEQQAHHTPQESTPAQTKGGGSGAARSFER